MLKALTVRDFALVQALEVDFAPGLTVITGESGAGKSILLGALGLVLGDRATSDAVRPGASRAEVTADFELSGHPSAQAFLIEHALEDADQPGRALVRRVVNREAGSRAYVNGAPVTLQVLRQLTEGLVDIHGQQEHQRLTHPATQLGLLDDYGVDRGLLAECQQCFRDWQASSAHLLELEQSLAAREDRASLLRYQVQELGEVAPREGEFEQLAADHKRLSQAEDLHATIAQALDTLEDADALARVERTLRALDDAQPALEGAREAMAAANALLDDATRDLRHYLDTLDVDPMVLQGLDERLGLFSELARKHKIEPHALSAHLEALTAELDTISTDQGALGDLRKAAAEHQARYRQVAVALTAARRSAADAFAGAVSQCMQTLGIVEGALVLEFKPAESERGLEAVEFLVVTNPKYPPAPLAKIASGGERTRISLAIAVVAAEKSALPCLILDEADVGVGGTTADVVGRLLRNLARHAQVICITHAPQVAALGQNHLRVRKTPAQDTHIEPLTPDERVDELARMLAGAGITEESKSYAKTLLSAAAAGGDP